MKRNRGRWSGELWEGGFFEDDQTGRHKTTQDDCVSTDVSFVWIFEIKHSSDLTSEKLCSIF